VKHSLLGKSGLRVSEAALGTMVFSDDWRMGIRSNCIARGQVSNRRPAAVASVVEKQPRHRYHCTDIIAGRFLGHRSRLVPGQSVFLGRVGSDCDGLSGGA
jgi:hypothetical protein